MSTVCGCGQEEGEGQREGRGEKTSKDSAGKRESQREGKRLISTVSCNRLISTAGHQPPRTERAREREERAQGEKTDKERCTERARERARERG